MVKHRVEKERQIERVDRLRVRELAPINPVCLPFLPVLNYGAAMLLSLDRLVAPGYLNQAVNFSCDQQASISVTHLVIPVAQITVVDYFIGENIGNEYVLMRDLNTKQITKELMQDPEDRKISFYHKLRHKRAENHKGGCSKSRRTNNVFVVRIIITYFWVN